MDSPPTDWVTLGVTVGIFIVVSIGSLIIYEVQRLHKRIDKATEEIHARIDKRGSEIDGHIKEGIVVHKSLERIETKLDLHMKNGLRHKAME